MSVQHLDLGKASFVSTKTNVLVEITAFAELYLPSGKHFDVRPGISRGGSAVFEDIWICKSHDFHLSFVISSDYDTTSPTGVELTHLEDIESTLERAQLWKQLALQPTLVQRSSHTARPFQSSRRQFVLVLRDDNNEQHQYQSGGLGLQTGFPDVVNLRAPENIQSVQLVSVLILLKFRPGPTCNDKEAWTSKVPDILTSASTHKPSRAGLQDDQRADRGSWPDFEALLENDDLGPWNTTVNVDHHSNATATTQKNSQQRISKSLVSLTDIAFRSLICPMPVRAPVAIMPCGENRLVNLVNLAPAVFIPGYCNAVHGRAKLVPVIAKFLSQFLQCTTRKARSKHNSKEIQASLIERVSEEKIPDQKENIKQHLWTTLTSGVKDVDSARKLKPLHIARIGASRGTRCRTFEDLLATWRSSDSDRDACSPGDDLEILCLDEEQECYNSEDESFEDIYNEVLTKPVAGSKTPGMVLSDDSDDNLCEALVNRWWPDGKLDAMLNPPCSEMCPEHTNSYEQAVVAAASGPSSVSLRTVENLRVAMDSYDSQLDEASQKCILTGKTLDLTGGHDYSQTYDSQTHPSNGLEDSGNFSAEHLPFELFNPHAFDADFSMLPELEQPVPANAQDIIDIDDDHHRKMLDISCHDIEVTAYEKSKMSSPIGIIDDDELLWQMLTKKSPTTVSTEDDMLEMHTAYAQDSDMQQSHKHENLDSNGEDYMLELEVLNDPLISLACPTGSQQDFVVPTGLTPVGEGKHNHLLQRHRNLSPASFYGNTSQPQSKQNHVQEPSFSKRMSGVRKSITGYDEISDGAGEDMLLN